MNETRTMGKLASTRVGLRQSALWRLAEAVLVADGRAVASWAIDVIMLGSVTLMILIGIDRGLSGTGGGLAIFATAVLINHILHPRFAARTSVALVRAVSVRTEFILDMLIRIDLEQFEVIGRHTLARRVDEDADQIASASPLMVQVVIGAVTVVLLIGYMATISYQAAMLSLVLLVAITTLTIVNGQAMRAQATRDRALGEPLREMVDDLVDGFAQVKQHRPRGDDLSSRFDAAAEALNHSRDVHFGAFYFRDTAGRQSFFALMAVVAFVLPQFVPGIASEIGRLLVAVTFVLPPLAMTTIAMTRLGQTSALWAQVEAVADRLESMAGPAPEATDIDGSAFVGLSVSKSSFGYPDTPDRAGFRIGPVDFDLKPGEIVFVTGANGSGKSTLIKLLCGLYRRHGGEFRLGDTVLPADPGARWRALFSVVFTDVVLFERLYGHEAVDPDWVNALLRDLEIDHKVTFADGAFDTVELSTGQRKRLGLVSALIHDRPIFVFDEWAADQDPRFRKLFYRRILPELRARGKAVLAVTHDDDAFDTCDRRLHLVGGRLEAR